MSDDLKKNPNLKFYFKQSCKTLPDAPSFNVVGSSAQNQLAAAIAGAESKPVKAYVVSSDVSTAQEFDRKIVEGASI